MLTKAPAVQGNSRVRYGTLEQARVYRGVALTSFWTVLQVLTVLRLSPPQLLKLLLPNSRF